MSAMYGKMKNIASTVTGAASSRYNSFASGVAGPSSGPGSVLGAIPAAARWGVVAGAAAAGVPELAPYEGMGKITFSVGQAVNHSGAAYGLTGVGPSALTERTVQYGQEDLRGTSRTRRMTPRENRASRTYNTPTGAPASRVTPGTPGPGAPTIPRMVP